jgi:acyl-CoA synthetase (AMP-forming)/AMP-acid ligase II
VTAFAVLHKGETAISEETTSYCKDKITGYKVPRKIVFIKDHEMPQSGTGKRTCKTRGGAES